MLNIADQPAWLKSVVLTFTILEGPSADALQLAAPSQVQAPAVSAPSVPSPPQSPAEGPWIVGDAPALDRIQDQGAKPDVCMVKRQRKQQGKKRFRLRQSSFGGTPQFARTCLESFRGDGAGSPHASAAETASSLSEAGAPASVPVNGPATDAQPAVGLGCLPVVNCAGTAQGQTSCIRNCSCCVGQSCGH